MHRNSLIEQLTAYGVRWPDEVAEVERFLGFVKTYSDCFERSLQLGHVTGSAWVVNDAGTHVLLTHHRKLDRWLQLGGHSDGDSDTVTVAMREIAEESGLVNVELIGEGIFDIDIHEIPERGKEPAHFHFDVRYMI
jgi:8-oxo-dGTP pyrophosphatase MutT (NUDIX family)